MVEALHLIERWQCQAIGRANRAIMSLTVNIRCENGGTNKRISKSDGRPVMSWLLLSLTCHHGMECLGASSPKGALPRRNSSSELIRSLRVPELMSFPPRNDDETCRKIVLQLSCFQVLLIIDSMGCNRAKSEGRSKFFSPTGAHPGLDSLAPETNLTTMIISFTSPPTLYPVSHSRIDVSEGEDVYMDDDLEAESATITTPGESITSARAFMR